MTTASGKFICDAEISGPPNWHGCRAKAYWAIQSQYCELHYCTKHKLNVKEPRDFRRAALADWKELPR